MEIESDETLTIDFECEETAKKGLSQWLDSEAKVCPDSYRVGYPDKVPSMMEYTMLKEKQDGIPLDKCVFIDNRAVMVGCNYTLE